MWKLHVLGKRSKISHLCIQLISTILPPSYTGWCAIKGNKNQGKKISWHHWAHTATAVEKTNNFTLNILTVCMHVLVSLAQGINKHWPYLFSVKIQKSVFCHMSVNIVNTHSVVKKKSVRSTKEASCSFKNDTREWVIKKGHWTAGLCSVDCFWSTSWFILPCLLGEPILQLDHKTSLQESLCLEPLG